MFLKGKAYKSRVHILTFLMLSLGAMDFILSDQYLLAGALVVLALLNLGRVWYNKSSAVSLIDISVQLCNAFLSGVCAYVYYHFDNTYQKWLWGILCFFYLLLVLLLIIENREGNKA